MLQQPTRFPGVAGAEARLPGGILYAQAARHKVNESPLPRGPCNRLIIWYARLESNQRPSA
jgi:hypothetical protein